MTAVNFEKAAIDMCDFSLTDMRHATLCGASAKDSTYIRAILQHADFSRAHLIGSDFKAADLRYADLSEANLFRANFALSRIDSTTALAGAYKKEVNTYPLRQHREAV